jgi:alginate O-acetyltransferase complex protein AlgI
MVFPTVEFLAFFSVVFPIYWFITRHRWRMGWLLLASCAFYMSWNPWLILLILFSASVDYGAALALERMQSPGWRRCLLIGSITANLGLLAYFKYVNFFLDSAGSLMGWCGVEMPAFVVNVTLPLGISFYTFETISYVVDVYLKRSKAVRNLLDYALFIMFFPHLVAGPIVRPRDFLPQLGRIKRFDWNRLYLGARFFVLGLIKKSIIADHLGQLVVDPVFKDPAGYGTWATWLAVLGYTVQIYCDFSGYSDMAIGLAHALGFKLPNNFMSPYLAVNIADFWRRWHISLSTWLRDYLYKPLGGNRGGTFLTYRNLILVMLLGGLWHGANWTFVAWGLYHGVLLALHKAIPWPRQLATPPGRIVCVAATFLLVVVGWVFFRAQTFGQAGTVLIHMFTPTDGLSLRPAAELLVVVCLGLTFLGAWIGTHVNLAGAERRIPAPVMGAALAAVILFALLLFPEDCRTFIYFQF